MKTIRFGRTNLTVPTVSLGTWGHGGPNINEGISVGWSGHDDAQAKEALVAAWRKGITHWDTADAYGNGHAEELIGSVWSEVPRDSIVLATKFGYVKGPSGESYGDTAFMRSHCERSLRNLKTDVIDIYYLHHCDFGPDDRFFEGALKTARQMQQEGKFRFLGLSDWDAKKIMKFIAQADPDVVQPYRNVVDDDYASSGLREWVHTHELGVAFFSPLKHGLLTGKYREPQHFPEGDFRLNIPEFGNTEAIAGMAQAGSALRQRFASQSEPVLHGLIGALLTDEPTATVLLGQRNRAQVEAAAAAGEALSEADAAWVREQYRMR